MYAEYTQGFYEESLISRGNAKFYLLTPLNYIKNISAAVILAEGKGTNRYTIFDLCSYQHSEYSVIFTALQGCKLNYTYQNPYFLENLINNHENIVENTETVKSNELYQDLEIRPHYDPIKRIKILQYLFSDRFTAFMQKNKYNLDIIIPDTPLFISNLIQEAQEEKKHKCGNLYFLIYLLAGRGEEYS